MSGLRRILAIGITFFVASVWAQNVSLVGILGSELKRNFDALKAKGQPPPYFLSYSVFDVREETISASVGAIVRSGQERRRSFDCEVRVGSPEFDNTHWVEGAPPQSGRFASLPVEDTPGPIRRIVWAETGHCYQNAVSHFTDVKQRQSGVPAPSEPVPDFSTEPPVTANAAVEIPKFDRPGFTTLVRNLSAAYVEFPGVIQSEVTLTNRSETRLLLSSEGTHVQTGSHRSRIILASRSKAGDGEDLALEDTFEAVDPVGLPKGDVLLQFLIRQADLMTRLKRAPETDPFAGPAIFSARASAMLFHEVLGQGILAHRGPAGKDALGRIGAAVLPESFGVVSAPTIAKAGPFDLIGAYTHDDEGVPARPVVVVEKGVLKELLLSRSPIPGFLKSNGHGRRQPGFPAVARQSNLFIDSTAAISNDQLKGKLLEEAKRQGKPYGLFIDRITGSAAGTAGQGRVLPISVVYRIYVDGRRDELVRGAVLVGDFWSIFKNVLAASDQKNAVNLHEAGPSGTLPVSVVAPPLLVSQVQIQRKRFPTDRPPFLPRPEDARTSSRR